ncbi:MAG: Hint domain-containing protein [Mycobacterium sp.]|nr:Hint domain-containing protein [Mycobacterium sp.]
MSHGVEDVYGTASGTTLSVGRQYVYLGGTTSGTMVRLKATEYVSSGGTAIGTVVSAQGSEYVSSGGTAIGTVVSNGGHDAVFFSGSASFTIVSSGGGEIVQSGGTTTSATVSNGGTENVSAGGTANDTIVSIGGFEYVSTGGTANDTVVNSGGYEYVSAGGTASGTIVSSGGGEYVSSGGTASGTVVSSGGTQYVWGGTTTSTSLSGGTEKVFFGTANGTVVSAGGDEYVYLDGTASGTIVSSGGYEDVFGAASGTIVSAGGYEKVSSGGAANGTVVTGGEEYVLANGNASGTVVSGGYEYVCAGGTASGTVVSSGGYEYVSGTAFGTTVNSGGVELVYAGGIANGATVENGGTLIVDAGGSAVDITVSGGGVEVVSAGGTAEGIVISAGGTAVLRSGAVTEGGIVLADIGARLEIDGTVMPGATISGLLAAATIDLANEAYSAGGQATLEANNVLQITGIGGTTIDLQLDQSQNYADTSFSLASDGSGGTDITTATTYTWVGGYDGSYSASVPQNWSPVGGPQAGDIIIVPAGSTLDVPSGATIADTTIDVSGPSTTVTYTGVTASGNTVTLGSGVVWNIGSSSITSDVDTFGTGDTLSLTDSSVTDASFSFATGDTLDLTGSTAGSMVIDPNGGGQNQTQLKQTGSDATLVINAAGTVTNGGFLWVDSPGGTTTLNVQNDGSIAGLYDSEGPLLVDGGTLVVNSATNVVNGNTLISSFANAGFLMDYGGTHAASVTINAQMNSVGGQMDVLGGANGATLVLNTKVSGSQYIEFGDGNGTLIIDSASSALANIKAHILDFQPGDTIDLAGLKTSGANKLIYSYGSDPTYGPGVLELTYNNTLIGVLRFAGSQFGVGTGTLQASGFSGTGSFVLTSYGSGSTAGTMITLPATTLTDVAAWAGGIGGDWSNTVLWTGNALPGEYQTAQFALTAAEADAIAGGSMSPYLVTVTSPETAGSVVFTDPLATMEIDSSLSLETQNTLNGGGSFQQTNGTVDITKGGTLSATSYYQVGDTLIVEAGGTLALAGTQSFSQGLGQLGLDVENDATITDGTITGGTIDSLYSLGATFIGEKASGSMYVGSGSSVTDTYTMIGGSTFASPGSGESSLTIDGPTTQWTDAGGDTTTPYSGAMLVGGGYTSVSGTLTNGHYVTSVPAGGNGMLTVGDRATLTEAFYAILGVTGTSSGSAIVRDGAQWLIDLGPDAAPTPGNIIIGSSTLDNPSQAGATVPLLTVGLAGSGVLDIFNGSTVQLGTAESPSTFSMVIGEGGSSNTTASGTVDVDGTLSLLDTGGGPLAIGNHGTGALSVTNGGTVLVGSDTSVTGFSFGAVLGNQNTGGVPSSGSLSVSGNGTAESLFTVQSGDLVIGNGGSGIADIQNNGSLSVAAGTIYLGGHGGGNPGAGPGGTLDVFGGQVQAAGLWIVNQGTTGLSSVSIAFGGTVDLDASPTLSAAFNLDSGSVEISGGGMLSLDASGTAEIGNAALTIDNNGTLQFAAGYIGSGYQLTIGNGSMSGSASTVTVENNGWLDASGPISIGQSNSGTLTVGANASVIDGKVGSGEPWSAVVGNNSAGTLTVGGGNAQFIASGAMAVGLNSSGALDVQQGGLISVGGELDVGGSPLRLSNGTGEITVDGGGEVGGARVSVAGDIVVGDNATLPGTDSLTVANGGSLYAAGTAYLGDTMQLGTLVASTDSGSLTLTSNAQAQFGGLALWSDSTVSIDGTSTLILGSVGIPIGAPGDILIGSDGVLSGGGTIGANGSVIDNGLIEATVPGSANLLQIRGGISGSGTLSIGAGATLEVGPVASTDTVVFSTGSPNVLALTIATLPFSMQASIEHFYAGNTIDLTGQPGSGVTLSWDQETAAGGVLSVTNGTTTIADLTFVGNYGTASFTTQSDGNGGTDIVNDTAPCFAAGTRLATTRGEVAVEQLRVGDEVRLAHGGVAPVLWLGYRTVDCARHPRPWDVMPVRVTAHAFGFGQPNGDLLLSPDHAVFIDGVLIPVRYLLNGATVVQEAASRVTYWHVELDHHDVLLAEGLACESYLDTGNRGAFANGGGATMVHPDFALRVWERESCAKLVWAGAELEAARSYLLDRAHELGFTITREPDLHLVVGGESLWPTAVADGVYRFTLPAGAGAVVIASRSAVPGEMSDVYEDGRRLGVMLARITFRQRGNPIGVALDTLPDDAGFHALEQDDRWCWRWTDGHARLDVPPGIVADAVLELELHVAASRPTWLAPARQSDDPEAGHEDGREVAVAA